MATTKMVKRKWRCNATEEERSLRRWNETEARGYSLVI